MTNNPIPEDAPLKLMEPILSKKLKNVSVKQWHEKCWLDRNAFYGPWLMGDCKDVEVGEWLSAKELNGPIINEWDKETYDRKRSISFKYTTGIFNAVVSETQYLRLQEDDRCVIAMSHNSTGVPYSDYFNVQIRWVATKGDQDMLLIQSGIFIVYLKSTMMKAFIRSSTMADVPADQRTLFDEMKQILGTEEG